MSNKPENKPKLWLRLSLVVLSIALIAGSLGLVKYLQLQELGVQGELPQSPTAVTVAVARSAAWKNQIATIGTLVALHGVDITSEVGGIVSKINFKSGQSIEQGELLLSLNNEVELSVVNSAKAQLSSARSQYRRTLNLKVKKSVSEYELDKVGSELKIAEATLQSATASLQKKSIKAPFSGTLGIKNVDEGDYIAPGTEIVTLQAIDKLYLDFSLPEQFYKEINRGQTVRFNVRSYPQTIFAGTVESWNPILHQTTRSASIRALVDNPERRLVPGMFAEIKVESEQTTTVLVVPETSIFYNIYGQAIYVLNPDNKSPTGQEEPKPDQEQVYILDSRQVDILYREGGMAGVNRGLQAGELVVTSGQLKLYPSLKVVITEDVPTYNRQDGLNPNKTAN